MHSFPGTQNSMRGSPWFRTAFRDLESIQVIREILVDVIHFNSSTEFWFEDLFKIICKFFPDNKYNFFKSGPDRIINGIIHYGFTTGTKSFYLFHASITGSHSCREYQ